MKIADISAYQGHVNWEKAGGELAFCILRASIGLKKDGLFEENAAKCREAGIPFHAYHYLKGATFDEVVNEADLFAQAAGPFEPLFYVLDCETDAITKAERKKPGTARALVDMFVFELKRKLGQEIRVGCYIAHHLYREWALEYAAFDYVWIPRYGGNSGEPEILPEYPCDIWQYTSKGKLAGVIGKVDLNCVVSADKPLEYFMTGMMPERKDEGPLFTGKQLAQWALDVYAAGWVYWYGTCGYTCKESLLKSKTKQYPSHYTEARLGAYAKDIEAGKTCSDCVGLIKSFFWKGGKLDGKNVYKANGCPDTSANGMIKLCTEKGKLNTMPDEPGLVVHKDGHIGIYVGDGMVVEMNSFAKDCLKRKISAGGWAGWGRLPGSLIRYEAEEDTPETVYTLGDRTLKKGIVGPDVAELQRKLVELGFDVGPDGIDGEYGANTAKAVKGLQASLEMEETGVFDAAAYKGLIDLLHPMKPDGEKDIPEDGSAPPWVLIIEGDEKTLKEIRKMYGGTLAAVMDVEELVDGSV